MNLDGFDRERKIRRQVRRIESAAAADNWRMIGQAMDRLGILSAKDANFIRRLHGRGQGYKLSASQSQWLRDIMRRVYR